MKKIFTMLLSILISIGLVGCVNSETPPDNNEVPDVVIPDNTNPDDEPDETFRVENWGDEILIGISANLSKFSSIGLARTENSYRKKLMNRSYKSDHEKLSHIIEINKTTINYVDDTVLIGETEDGVEEVDFIGDVSGEFNIYKLFVQENYTFITITPKTPEGEIEDAQGNPVIVARTHSVIQERLQETGIDIVSPSGEVLRRLYDFDASGYETNAYYQSYIIDNESGNIFEFPEEMKYYNIQNNLLYDHRGVVNLDDFLASPDYKAKDLSFIRPDIIVYGIYMDAHENIYVVNNWFNMMDKINGVYYMSIDQRETVNLYVTDDSEIIVFPSFIVAGAIARGPYMLGPNLSEIPIDFEKEYNLKENMTGVTNNIIRVVHFTEDFTITQNRDELLLDVASGSLSTSTGIYLHSNFKITTEYDGRILNTNHTVSIGKYIVLFDYDKDNNFIYNMRYVEMEPYVDIAKTMFDPEEVSNRWNSVTLSTTEVLSNLDPSEIILLSDQEYTLRSGNAQQKTSALLTIYVPGEGFTDYVLGLDENGIPALFESQTFVNVPNIEIELRPIN